MKLASYFGGKGSCYQHIINVIPPHKVFISSHMGQCGVMRNKRPALMNIGFDLDVSVLRYMGEAGRTNSVDMSYFDQHRDSDPDYLFLWMIGEGMDPMQSFLTALELGTATGQWFRTTQSKITTAAAAVENNCGIRRYIMACGDSVSWLEKARLERDVFVYSDPPYTLNERGHNRYRFDYTHHDHVQLLDCLTSLDCYVAISGYDNELYRERLSNWSHIEFDAQTRGGVRREHLWFNYPHPEQLHDYRYLGDNKMERQCIKRSRNNVMRKLERMDVRERNALLNEIEKVYLKRSQKELPSMAVKNNCVGSEVIKNG